MLFEDEENKKYRLESEIELKYEHFQRLRVDQRFEMLSLVIVLFIDDISEIQNHA